MRWILSLLVCSQVWAAVPVPVSQAYTFEITLFDGAGIVTGATVTTSVGKDTDADGVDDQWWNGSAWTTYNAVSMTEETGNIHLEGKYKYVLSSTGVGSTSNVTINFSSKYSSGGITLYNRESIRTQLPTTSGGLITDTSGTTTLLSRLTSARAGYLDTLDNVATMIESGPDGYVFTEEAFDTVADAISGRTWDTSRSGHGNSGTFGEYVDAAVSSRLASGSYTAPDNSGITDIKTVTDNLATGMEADGLVYRFTTNALEQAPAGGGGGGSLTEEEHDWLEGIFGHVGSTPIVISSPVASDGTITIYQGASYTGTTLTATVINRGGESLVDGSVSVLLVGRSDYASGTATPVLTLEDCTFTNGTAGSTMVVNIELTSEQTAALNVTQYKYQIIGTTSGGHVLHPLGDGTCVVKRMVQ